MENIVLVQFSNGKAMTVRVDAEKYTQLLLNLGKPAEVDGEESVIVSIDVLEQ